VPSTPPGLGVSSEDIAAAAARVAQFAPATPIVPLPTGTDPPVLLKLESLQRTGSFKIRGAANALLALEPRAVVTASSGNHGHALAAMAAELGIPATIVMPANASAFKRAFIEGLGARVVECAPDTASREATTEAVATRTGATVVPPYDHPLVIAGQGTVGAEITSAVPDVSTIVVPVGGGGLISGIAVATKTAPAAQRPPVVIGAEPACGRRFALSRAAGHPVEVAVPDTICDGARTQRPGAWTGPIVEALVDDLVGVDDGAVVRALRVLAAAGLWVEPTGALAVAAALAAEYEPPVVCVVSGRNVAPSDLAALLAR